MSTPAYRKRSIGSHALQPSTLMMGYGYDPALSEGAIKPPLFQTSTFLFSSAEEGKAFFEIAYGLREKREGEELGLIYSRINNPNLEVLEDRLAVLDRAEASASFASGMAAISTALWAFNRPGDVILYSEPVYGGTEYLLKHILPQFGIRTVGFAAEGGCEAMHAVAREAAALGPVTSIYIETPANPTGGLVDIAEARKLSESLAKGDKRPPVLVDNTMLGPLCQFPLDLGADLSIMSLTKYVGGHSDVIGGSVSASGEWLAPVKVMRTILGTMPDPHTCWLIMRSLETLHLRMRECVSNARRVAAFLAEHPMVASVWYLEHLPADHPDRAVYEKQCLSAGSTFAFEVVGGEAEAFRVLNALQHIKLAVSLGGTETLASHPSSMTHSDFASEDKRRLSISDALIRVAVGVEDADDLIADLAQALAGLSSL
ncbi:cystathionine gamma-synthase family protein [Novosphingobium sp. Gsoil 351]|uniref:cystathionine gamma-synthase family protein n=1 Tax=Novosphingobium sp. Gsoil 351 TaxID=2675225 RepID=UPI0012B45450|nr:cystathionine gamma-synthase family protein [Novosphingobium sp. Gsoil 351]QGN55464.1 cystathionine gamma-synthase family protein [Novosphingobium sp. Gsoil 351]